MLRYLLMSESQNSDIAPKMDSWHCPLSAFRLISGCCVTYYHIPGTDHSSAWQRPCFFSHGGQPNNGQWLSFTPYQAISTHLQRPCQHIAAQVVPAAYISLC